jgi:glycosyltransferase involved in cell wall biosynthesis
MYPNLAPQVVYSPMPEFETLSRVEIRPFVREELKTPRNACVIIQVSRMEAWKGHEPHLLALRQLRDNHDWFCWMVGGPQNDSEVRYFEGLQKLAHRLGISDRVRFLGQRKDVPRLLAAADVFCQPNTGTEGFSWVFMEAFAASLPIVTSAIGGADELVDACSGVLLPPGDADALARALEKFIGNPDLCQRMGEAGYRRVHQMCDRARQIQQLYQALLPFRTDSPVFKLP